MAWMAGNIGAILAVLLLGCTRTCRMVRASLTVRLNQANQVIAVLAIAVRREDRHYTLAVEAPDRLSRNARRDVWRFE